MEGYNDGKMRGVGGEKERAMKRRKGEERERLKSCCCDTACLCGSTSLLKQIPLIKPDTHHTHTLAAATGPKITEYVAHLLPVHPPSHNS